MITTKSSDEIENDFKLLLSYLTAYVNIKQPLSDKLLIDCKNGKIQIYTRKFTKIAEFEEDKENLLDMLVFIAPKEIELYNIKKFNNRLLRVLLAIFKERISFNQESLIM